MAAEALVACLSAYINVLCIQKRLVLSERCADAVTWITIIEIQLLSCSMVTIKVTQVYYWATLLVQDGHSTSRLPNECCML